MLSAIVSTHAAVRRAGRPPRCRACLRPPGRRTATTTACRGRALTPVPLRACAAEIMPKKLAKGGVKKAPKKAPTKGGAIAAPAVAGISKAAKKKANKVKAGAGKKVKGKKKAAAKK